MAVKVELKGFKLKLNKKFYKMNIFLSFKKDSRSGFGNNRKNSQIMEYLLARLPFAKDMQKSATYIVRDEFKKFNKTKEIRTKGDINTILSNIKKSKAIKGGYLDSAESNFKDKPKFVYYKGKKYDRVEGMVSEQVYDNLYMLVEVEKK